MTTCFCSAASVFSRRSLRLITGSLSFLVGLSAVGVAQNNLYVDVTAPGNGNGFTWTNAYNHLEVALLAASPGDNIMLAEGVYRPGAATGSTLRTETFNITTWVQIYGGYKGYNNGNPGVSTPNDPDGSRFNTNLSGDIRATPSDPSDDAFHVVTVSATDPTTRIVLDGVQISSGNADGTGTDESIGGGILVKDSWLRMADGFLRQNMAAGNGAGVHVSGSSRLDLLRGRVRRNQSMADGGGIYSTGNTEVRIFNLDMSQNLASGRGGALRFTSTSEGSLLLANSVIYDNQAGLGGGISMDGAFADRKVINCTISFNKGNGSGTAGAGIHVDSHTASVQLLNSIVYFNPEITNDDNIWTGSPGSFAVDHSNVGNSVSGLALTAHTLNLDPEFSNPGLRRMGLKKTSPCLDAGDDGLIPLDFLDIDENGVSDMEKLNRDIKVQANGSAGFISPREQSVVNCPVTGFGHDAFPFEKIVDMGAYEQTYTCPGPMN